MNQLLKQISMQCRTAYRDSTGEYIISFDQEKFAELVVRECAQVALEGGDPVIAQDIFAKFGLAEQQNNWDHYSGLPSPNAYRD